MMIPKMIPIIPMIHKTKKKTENRSGDSARITKYQRKNTLTDDIVNIQKCEIDVEEERCYYT